MTRTEGLEINRKKAVAPKKKVVVEKVNEEVRILRVQTKKGRGTEEMKAAVAGTEKIPRKMEGRTKEGTKEAVARVDTLPRTIKGWTKEDRKDLPCLPSTSFIFSFEIRSKTLHISFCTVMLTNFYYVQCDYFSLPQIAFHW